MHKNNIFLLLGLLSTTLIGSVMANNRTTSPTPNTQAKVIATPGDTKFSFNPELEVGCITMELESDHTSNEQYSDEELSVKTQVSNKTLLQIKLLRSLRNTSRQEILELIDECSELLAGLGLEGLNATDKELVEKKLAVKGAEITALTDQFEYYTTILTNMLIA